MQIRSALGLYSRSDPVTQNWSPRDRFLNSVTTIWPPVTQKWSQWPDLGHCDPFLVTRWRRSALCDQFLVTKRQLHQNGVELDKLNRKQCLAYSCYTRHGNNLTRNLPWIYIEWGPCYQVVNFEWLGKTESTHNSSSSMALSDQNTTTRAWLEWSKNRIKHGILYHPAAETD